MAGTMTFTYDDGASRKGRRSVRKVICDWVADGSGDASGTTEKLCGAIVRGVTNPSGVDAPNDNYDITITDEEGVDVLGKCIAAGQLQNRDFSTTEQVYFFVENVDVSPLATSRYPVVDDKLTVTIAAAGGGGSGRLILYLMNG